MSRRTKYVNGVAVVPAGPRPPAFEEVAARLRRFGATHPEIARLEVFGSVADGDAGPGSDADVLVTFGPGQRPRGLAYFGRVEALRAEIATVLGGGVTVDLHERTAAERCENPVRRAGVLGSARTVYGA